MTRTALTKGTTGAQLISAFNGNFIEIYKDSDLSLVDAITAAGANNTTILVSSPQTIAANLTIPINVSLQIEREGIITVNNGVTLTINGVLIADCYQIFVATGSVVFGRQISKAYPEWFGITGTADEVGINKALAAFGSTGQRGGVIEFSAKKTYNTTSAIKFYGDQIINCNKAVINSSSTGNVIEPALKSSAVVTNTIINDIEIQSSSAAVGINLTATMRCVINNPKITISTVNAIAIHLLRGSGVLFCYFNIINNPSTSCVNGKGIVIEGAAGISGANMNKINGGSDSSFISIHILNNSAGNVIMAPYLELSTGDEATGSIGIKIDASPGNIIISPEIEWYEKHFVFDATSAGNFVIGHLQGGEATDVITDLGINHWFTRWPDGGVGFSQAGKPTATTGTAWQFHNPGNALNLRLDIEGASSANRNWAVENNEGIWNFYRSATKGANPMSGIKPLSITATGPRTTLLPVYADNAAAKAGGLVDGDQYRTSTGMLMVVYT